MLDKSVQVQAAALTALNAAKVENETTTTNLNAAVDAKKAEDEKEAKLVKELNELKADSAAEA